jgi:hypothetical protein
MNAQSNVMERDEEEREGKGQLAGGTGSYGRRGAVLMLSRLNFGRRVFWAETARHHWLTREAFQIASAAQARPSAFLLEDIVHHLYL